MLKEEHTLHKKLNSQIPCLDLCHEEQLLKANSSLIQIKQILFTFYNDTKLTQQKEMTYH